MDQTHACVAGCKFWVWVRVLVCLRSCTCSCSCSCLCSCLCLWSHSCSCSRSCPCAGYVCVRVRECGCGVSVGLRFVSCRWLKGSLTIFSDGPGRSSPGQRRAPLSARPWKSVANFRPLFWQLLVSFVAVDRMGILKHVTFVYDCGSCREDVAQ
jgi:hypothetical protein